MKKKTITPNGSFQIGQNFAVSMSLENSAFPVSLVKEAMKYGVRHMKPCFWRRGKE